MKKFFLTMTVMAIFAIGFAASDESNSPNSNNDDNSSSSTQTEQEQEVKKQETEAERVAKEKQEKIKKIADMAYKKGWNKRMNSRDFPDPRGEAHMEYTMRYGVEPTEPGEEERWNIFVENYVKGYEAAWEEIRKKMHSEDL